MCVEQVFEEPVRMPPQFFSVCSAAPRSGPLIDFWWLYWYFGQLLEFKKARLRATCNVSRTPWLTLASTFSPQPELSVRTITACSELSEIFVDKPEFCEVTEWEKKSVDLSPKKKMPQENKPKKKRCGHESRGKKSQPSRFVPTPT